MPRLSSQLERDNAQGLRDTTAEFQRLRDRLGVALGAVFGALVLSLALSVFAYRRLLRPLGAVTTSLHAVLTGRQPTANVAETPAEFGDIFRAMRRQIGRAARREMGCQ